MSLKQDEVLRAIVDLTAKNGYPPSFRDIAKHLGGRSSSTIAFHMEILKSHGIISYEKRRSRTITINKVPA